MKRILAKFFVLAISLFLAMATFGNSAVAETKDITELTVYVNGNAVWHGDINSEGQLAIPSLERDSYLSVRAVFKANTDVSDVKIRAWINGYRNEIEDRTSEFDMFGGMQYSKTLTLEIPEDIDAKDEFTLYVKIESKRELLGVDEAKIDTTVQRISNKLKILDINLWSYKESAEGFKAGTTMYADIVLKNIGNHLAEDVFLKLNIPELGVTRTIYVGDIGSIDNQYEDTRKTTIALPLPEEAETGSYTLEIEAFNSKLDVEGIEAFKVFNEEDEEAEDEESEEEETQTEGGADWEDVAMIISIILAVAIIVLLVLLLVKQRAGEEEKPEEAESFY